MHGKIENIQEAIVILAKEVEKLSDAEHSCLSADIHHIVYNDDDFADHIIKSRKGL